MEELLPGSTELRETRERLRPRFNDGNTYPSNADLIESVCSATSRSDSEQVTADDTVDALRLISGERMSIDYRELRLIEAARDRGLSWPELGKRLGGRTAQAMQQRYRRLGGERSWPTGPKTSQTTDQGEASE